MAKSKKKPTKKQVRKGPKVKIVWLFVAGPGVQAAPDHVAISKGNKDEVVWLARDDGNYEVDFNGNTPFNGVDVFPLGAQGVARSQKATSMGPSFKYTVTELKSGKSCDPDVQVDQ